MAFPAARVLQKPERTPLNVLFPESYEASKREIVRDFVFFGTTIVVSILLGAMANLAVSRLF